VDDHPVVREGLVAALDGRDGIEVAGSFERAEEAIHAAERLKPDVVVLDLELPGLGGFDAIPRFRAPVLVLTAYGTEEDVHRAFEAGAKGYVLKGTPLDDIARAIAAVAAGGQVVDPRVAGHLIARAGRSRLTGREREVLRLVAGGDANKVIAGKLGISERTVKFHVTSILTKLGADNRAGAVAIAAEKHLL
jgi:two-component system, NarL family, response regulator LiaR